MCTFKLVVGTHLKIIIGPHLKNRIGPHLKLVVGTHLKLGVTINTNNSKPNLICNDVGYPVIKRDLLSH
jgi:hypothetical protein